MMAPFYQHHSTFRHSDLIPLPSGRMYERKSVYTCGEV